MIIITSAHLDGPPATASGAAVLAGADNYYSYCEFSGLPSTAGGEWFGGNYAACYAPVTNSVFEGCVFEFGDYGIHLPSTALFNKFTGCRADRNWGHGFYLNSAAHNMFAACTSHDNSKETANTYDQWHLVSAAYNSLVGCNTFASEAVDARYGFYDNTAAGAFKNRYAAIQAPNGWTTAATGGGATFTTAAGLADLVDDTTPQLGGTLDTNGNEIVFPSSMGVGDKITLYDGGAGGDYKLGVAAGTVYYNTASTGKHQFQDNGATIAEINAAGITVIAEPTIDAHFATKAYVDLVAASTATRAGVRVVAGSGESAEVKALADFVCDGTADEVQINAAMAALTPSLGSIGTTSGGTMGGVVLLVGRQFNIAGPILQRHYTVLRGAYGTSGTWITASGYAPGASNGFVELADGNQQYTVVEDLGLDGGGASVSGIYHNMATGYEWDGNHIGRRLFIRDMGQDGVHVDNDSGGRLRNNHYSELNIINVGRYGLNIDCPDSFWHQIHIVSSGSHGVYLAHANHRLTSVKSCFSDGDGFHCTSAGRDNQFAACESQDNQGHGFYFNQKRVSGSALVADSNSYGAGVSNSDGFHFTATANGSNVSGTASDKNEGGRGFWQRYGVNLVGSPKVIVNVTSVDNVSGALNGTGGTGSVVNVFDAA